MLWFTADLHLGHENIIKFSKRPYQSVDEMDQALLDNWNECVKETDDIVVIGDLAFFQASNLKRWMNQANGNKFLIRGNHDMKKVNEDIQKKFIWVKDLYTMKVADPDAIGGNQFIALCHYAFRTWDKKHYGAWNLHGHSHGSLPMLPGHKQLDVGVDVWNYRPVSYDTIKRIMADIEDKPVDHHRSTYGEE